jgi:hypothetical protein
MVASVVIDHLTRNEAELAEERLGKVTTPAMRRE